ncbi:PHD-zinc-finger like domain-containing protein [Amylocystis lapponica]|nr:PHD-zinc-finger like domain-containing protein [Amylocystis lapponica]
MARGPASPVPSPLPKVSFVQITDDVATKPSGVTDLWARSYGYNDFSDFRRPEHYIRYIEPLESELAVQVEYDMDEQDQEWLDAINAERKKEQLDKVSYEVFEIVMDRLEKEWFDLTKNIPKPDLALPSEDSTCAICDDSEGENTNAIVFCDGCNLAVHQDCYGVPYIPEGQWLCRKCTVSPENPVSCILCPNEGGAFKQTVHGDWVHLLCAIWVPETRVANEVFMEPITGIERISKQRWKLKCSICDVREGACIQCTKASCFLAFHATCARKERLLMPMKATQGSEAPTLACYCEKHLPKEQQETRTAALAAEHSDGSGADDKTPSPKLSKTARAYAKTYKPGPPLVPHIIVERILQYIARIQLRQKREFVLLLCKYWSLKREARRGAAFLKRLHLEPWTASAGGKLHTEEEKAIKLEFLKRLKQELESIRELTELSRKRESRKREQAELIQDVFSRILFAHEPSLRMAFEKITSFDRNEFFKNAVSRVDVPDYYDIIKHPMYWTMIDRKLDRHEYLDLQDFKDDVNLVLSNAMIYNKPGTSFYKAAQRIKASAEPIMADLHKLALVDRAPPPSEAADTSVVHPSPLSAVGDLEPPLQLLNLLISEDAIKDDVELILEKEPLLSLFSYEFPKFKPPPPPPVQKPKRNRKVDLERKRLERQAAYEARYQGNFDSSPGFRAPRTRRAAAAAAVFESEVVEPSESAESQPEAGPSNIPAPVPSVRTSRKVKTKANAAGVASSPAPMVDAVDNQQSFKMFDQGWILPPDQKRGGRAAVERHPLPPPKKKAKTARGKSHLSTVSTSAADNETLLATSPPAEPADEGAPVAPPASADAMIVDEPEPGPSTTAEPPGNEAALADQPIRPIIIEDLDTPATRREKHLRRKAEKEWRNSEKAAAATTTSVSAPVPSQPDNEEAEERAALESDSDLTDLTGESDDEDMEEEDAVEKELPKVEVEPGEVVLAEGEYLEGGTLVWAKADFFPWWPAVVFEPDDPEIPKGTLRALQIKEVDGPLHLIRFYDKKETWNWLGLDRLKMLGENDGLDHEMMNGGRRQRFKNVSLKNQCRAAYRRAMREKEEPQVEDDEEDKYS